LARLLNLPAKAIIDGFKKTIDYYICRGVPCARKWPRSPGHKRAPGVENGWAGFTEANKLWSSLPLNIKEAFTNMSKGVPLTGKDMFVKSYLSNAHIEIYPE
jgi:hypothetical protein